MSSKMTEERLKEQWEQWGSSFWPNPFLILQEGQPVFSIMDGLISSAEKHKMMEFRGRSPWIYYRMPYCEPEDPAFSCLNRLHETIESAAGRQGVYMGCLCLDVSQWLEHEREEYYDALLGYLSDRSDTVYSAFLVQLPRGGKEGAVRDLYLRTAGYFRVEEIRVQAFGAASYLNDMKTYMKNREIRITRDGMKYLEEMLEEVSQSPWFQGRETAINLCQDIMFHLEKTDMKHTVNAEFLEEYQTDSGYLACFQEKERAGQPIGLIR